MARNDAAPRRGRMYVARSRGALSGLLLVLLGAWGALVPFIGPYAHYAYTPATAWTMTSGRFWLEVLPGIAAVVAGLMLMVTANRSVGVFAGWLASLAGAWFLVGPVLGRLWHGSQGAAGTPTGGTTRQVWEQIGFFTGLGAVILFLGALALGRFTVRSVRDVVDHDAAASDADRGGRGRRGRRDRAEFEGNQVAATPTRTEVVHEPVRGSDATTEIPATSGRGTGRGEGSTRV